MPITPTYPGVYVEELASGVRTIAGVSTSVTVFIGAAKRGPFDTAVTVRSWADYERRFGGLDVGSEMSYSVRQFFNNGGSEAIVIRVGHNVNPAQKTFLYVPADATKASLTIKAADGGKAGNAIEIRITHSGTNAFGIVATLHDPQNPMEEKFDNLSMNSMSPRYVVSVVNSSSQLIRVERAAITFDRAATAESGDIEAADWPKIDADHRFFQMSLNGGEFLEIELTPPIANNTDLATAIFNEAKAKGTGDAYGPNFKVDAIGTKRIRITSGKEGEVSSVRILPGVTKDVASIIHLGADNGGTDTDGTAAFRPAVSPSQPFLVSGDFALADFELPGATKKAFKITLGGVPEDIDLQDASQTNAGVTLAEKLALLAGHITNKVRAEQPAQSAFTGFTATVHPDGKKLVFTSGSGGPSSTITLNNAAANNILDDLHFADGATATGALVRLAGGTDDPYDDSNLEAIFRGSRAKRSGIYALEAVDIFNLLCLPGITKQGVISEALAYCEERRAFLILDPPAAKDPDQMLVEAQAYPKHKNAALYYPRLGISDPLQGSIIRMLSPSGTMAGVMARTDAQRGVWKAPAGIDASLVGVQKLEYVLTDAQNGALNPRAINCLRIFPNYGAVAWGARTQVGDDNRGDEWKYIPVRRLALYIEESLYRGTKWAVFEPNDEPLWAQLRMNIGAFMHDLFRQGAFAGSSPRDAYLVQCDKTTTTQSDVNRGIVNVLIGFAPLKPAEFVFLKIQQLAGQLTA